MRDINFFSIYYKKNATNQTQIIRFAFLGLGIALIVGALYFTLVLRLGQIKSATVDIQNFLKTDAVSSSVDTADTYKSNRLLMDTYATSIVEFRDKILKSTTFDSVFLTKLADAIPKTASLTEITGEYSNVKLVFTAPDLTVTSQLDNSLHTLDIFKSVTMLKATYDDELNVYVVEFEAKTGTQVITGEDAK